jgi:hypothetical protein
MELEHYPDFSDLSVRELTPDASYHVHDFIFRVLPDDGSGSLVNGLLINRGKDKNQLGVAGHCLTCTRPGGATAYTFRPDPVQNPRKIKGAHFSLVSTLSESRYKFRVVDRSQALIGGNDEWKEVVANEYGFMPVDWTTSEAVDASVELIVEQFVTIDAAKVFDS